MGARQNKFPFDKCMCEQWLDYVAFTPDDRLLEFANTTFKTTGTKNYYIGYNDGNFNLNVEDEESITEIEISHCPFCGKKLDWNETKEKYLKKE